jgi:hypothetical protein
LALAKAASASEVRPNAFAVPGHGVVWIEPDSHVMSLYGLIVLALHTESNAFACPGQGIVWIEPDGLVISLYGLIVLALVSESHAFACPDQGVVWIEPDGLVISLYGLIVLALPIKSTRNRKCGSTFSQGSQYLFKRPFIIRATRSKIGILN